jgi:hypothetical protein
LSAVTVGPDAAARQADALVGAGRIGEAVEVLADAVTVHTERPELWGRLAAALLAIGRLSEAWDAAARTVALAPAEPEAHRTIGSVALAMRAWPQAETAFRHVLTLNPGDPAARVALARIPASQPPPPAGTEPRRDRAPEPPPARAAEPRPDRAPEPPPAPAAEPRRDRAPEPPPARAAEPRPDRAPQPFLAADPRRPAQSPAVDPLGPGTGQFPAVDPLGPGTGQFPAVDPLGPGTGQFPAVDPLGPGAGQFPAGDGRDQVPPVAGGRVDPASTALIGPPVAGGPPGGRRRIRDTADHPMATEDLRLGFVRWLRGQWVLGVAAYLGLAYEGSAPYVAGAVTLILVPLGAFGWLRWQGLPASLKAEVIRRPRTDPRARLLVGLALLGGLGIVAVVPASMLGALMAARLATVGSVAVTVAAAVLAGRDRQAAAAAAPSPTPAQS